ncbi:emp24/gp25L/p24 family/GOLD-domain-containing protein [Phlyctochytrium arcticum]|nr:emp24/gp25L/p24 family/GOLD-domain-containing protein [Phlyctochytrium arcticum]
MLWMGSASAVTLTYKMEPHEKACFYTTAKTSGEKIAFYFAVQSGGSFDLDYEVLTPSMNVLTTGHKERQGDFVLSAPEAGEYSFCFSNRMSTFSEKTIDFDITAEHEHAVTSTLAQENSGKQEVEKHVKPIEESINNLTNSVQSIQRSQKYFRTRENRNFDTVRSTTNRLFWFGSLESFLLVSMSVVQVFIIQTFFNRSGKIRV